MKIKSITIVRMQHGADAVYLETDLPEAMHPYSGNLDLKFTVAKGSAEAYCKNHFPEVPIKAIV